MQKGFERLSLRMLSGTCYEIPLRLTGLYYMCLLCTESICILI